MLVTFKSKAAADVLMYEEHAKPILDLLHKDLKRGVIVADELPAAIQTLEAHLAQLRSHASGQDDSEQDEADGRERAEPVGFATRVYPVLEMLRAAQKRGASVAWGI